MHLVLKSSRSIAQEIEWVGTVRNSLAEIGTGNQVDTISMTREGGNLVLQYGVNRVSFYTLDNDDDFWLKFERGTKGNITTHWNDEEIIDSTNATLNWLIHQEFSSDNHTELTERLNRERAKYAD